MSAAVTSEALPSARYVINHDVMSCTAEGVVGNHLYSGRALGISQPWDMIQLHPALQAQWPAIRDHYRRIGLTFTEDVIWDLDLKELGAHLGYQPSVFFFGPRECAYWGDHVWLETVEHINSKNNFMQLADELGIDVPKTLCFDGVSKIDSDALEEITYPCYLKAAVSVSGVGIYRCGDEAELVRDLACLDAHIPVQVQEEIDTGTFLNLQYQVHGNEVFRLVASEQILDGFAHQGNRVPASHEPWAAVDPMAYWLKDHGMKGIFAFDVAVVQTDAGLRFPAIECNPRFNGASYPTLIAQKLGIGEWNAVTMSTRHRSLADVDLNGIEYDRTTGEGAVLVNWGTVTEGKLVILMAGSRDYQEALAIELEARLC